jgi:hypothetical protein
VSVVHGLEGVDVKALAGEGSQEVCGCDNGGWQHEHSKTERTIRPPCVNVGGDAISSVVRGATLPWERARLGSS